MAKLSSIRLSPAVLILGLACLGAVGADGGFDFGALEDISSACTAGFLEDIAVATCLADSFKPLSSLSVLNVNCSDLATCQAVDPAVLVQQLANASKAFSTSINSACHKDAQGTSCIDKLNHVLNSCDTKKLSKAIIKLISDEEQDEGITSDVTDLIVESDPLQYVEVLGHACSVTPSGKTCGSSMLEASIATAYTSLAGDSSSRCTAKSCSPGCRQLLLPLVAQDTSCCLAELAGQALDLGLKDGFGDVVDYLSACNLSVPTRDCKGKAIPSLVNRGTLPNTPVSNGDDAGHKSKTPLIVAAVAAGVVMIAVGVFVFKRKRAGHAALPPLDERDLVLSSDDDDDLLY